MPPDVLRSRAAGRLVIRGAAARVGVYGAGLALTAVASAFLLRHLGVVAFGRYATVIAILGIVGGLADAGLTVVGQREYVLLDSDAARRRLLGTIAGLRIAITPLGVLLAVGFGVLAGYPSSMVLGTVVAGGGVLCTSAASSLAIPLVASLRLGAVAVTELARQVALTLAIGVLVAAGAGLPAFFAAQLVAGAAMLAATVVLLGRAAAVTPRFSPREAWPILREAAPVAAGMVVNVVYLRTLVIVVSLTGTAIETGLFGTSARLLEPVAGIPFLMIGSAFPILAAAAAEDEGRLRGALERLAEAALVVAAGLALAIALAADPIVRVLGGAQYADAVPVLRVQALALVGAFMTQVWSAALVAVRAPLAIVAANAVGLGLVLALGLTLVPRHGAMGAAVAAVVGEVALAATTLVLLRRARPGLRSAVRRPVRVALAAAAGAAWGLAPALPDVAAALLGMVTYGLAVWALRIAPAGLAEALLRRPAATVPRR